MLASIPLTLALVALAGLLVLATALAAMAMAERASRLRTGARRPVGAGRAPATGDGPGASRSA